ncbi:hypothetical protein [Streptomyces sp. AC558_RSS880]|uniref:hypothetical protein n=1 Tax=Streptomyces sp. AC558_RSS880 TaxID=2823687 RepID=UPI001C234FDB|nr:hypothetical protein [Streptomyces sp. AC558_RSS880]
MRKASLIGRDFTAAAPGRNLVGVITDIPTNEGWLYPATWLDLATREILGYLMASPHRASPVVDALTMAPAAEAPSPAASRTRTVKM